jgi:hypothetical protein
MNALGDIWYQVWFPIPEEKQKLLSITYYAKTFGFAANDKGVITKHPEYWWVGKKLEDYKPELLKIRAQVGKIN